MQLIYEGVHTPCERCGKELPESQLYKVDGKSLCWPCAQHVARHTGKQKQLRTRSTKQIERERRQLPGYYYHPWQRG